MVDAVVSGPELPVLDVADQVLREERVASPETIRDVHPSAETLLLGAGEALHRAPDHGAVDVEPDHQIRGEASGEAGEVVPAMRADEVRDDVPARPVAARELVVIERDRRGPRVLEPGVEPVLAEELEQVDASDAARGAPPGEEARREHVAGAKVSRIPVSFVYAWSRRSSSWARNISTFIGPTHWPTQGSRNGSAAPIRIWSRGAALLVRSRPLWYPGPHARLSRPTSSSTLKRVSFAYPVARRAAP